MGIGNIDLTPTIFTVKLDHNSRRITLLISLQAPVELVLIPPVEPARPVRQDEDKIKYYTHPQKTPERQTEQNRHGESPDSHIKKYQTAVWQKRTEYRPEDFYRIQCVKGIEHHSSEKKHRKKEAPKGQQKPKT